jgi:glycosyltransferase involved in cell wall biosynthesis
MNSSTPLVSIQVPAYNAARYLPGLCHSIQAQTYPHYEVLIGDDGSTDDTTSVLAQFLEDTRFQIVRWQPNRGLCRGMEIMCAAMRGEYWCCTGADDLFYPTFLEKRVEMLESNPQAFLVHGRPELINESGKPVPDALPLLDLPAQLSPPRSLEVLLEHDVVNAPSVMVRSSVTRQVLPFFHWKWEYAPDWFFWILHAATGFDLLWDGRVLNKYRVHSESLTSSPSKAAMRHAEVALTPLCALAVAARFSGWAAVLWSRWRRALYHRWILRALKLRVQGRLDDQWLQQGAAAFCSHKGSRVSLWSEAIRHVPGALITRLSEGRAVRLQRFPVAGIAQVNDPLFR